MVFLESLCDHGTPQCKRKIFQLQWDASFANISGNRDCFIQMSQMKSWCSTNFKKNSHPIYVCIVYFCMIFDFVRNTPSNIYAYTNLQTVLIEKLRFTTFFGCVILVFSRTSIFQTCWAQIVLIFLCSTCLVTYK